MGVAYISIPPSPTAGKAREHRFGTDKVIRDDKHGHRYSVTRRKIGARISTALKATTTIIVAVLTGVERFVDVVPAARLHVVDQGAVLDRPVRDDDTWSPPRPDLLDAMIGVRVGSPGEHDELLDACARHFAEVVGVRRTATRHRAWLVAVNRSPTVDSPLRRYVGARPEREGLAEELGVPASSWTDDIVLRSGSQLRFAAALELNSLEAAGRVVHQQRSTAAMIFTERDLREPGEVGALLEIAWTELKANSTSVPRWSLLLHARAHEHDVVARPFGNFDDPERRIDLLGTQRPLGSILMGRGQEALQSLLAMEQDT